MDKRYKTKNSPLVQALGLDEEKINKAITLDLIYENIDNRKSLISSVIDDMKIYILEHKRENMFSKKLILKSALIIDVEKISVCFKASKEIVKKGIICNGQGVYDFIINYYRPDEVVLGKSLCFTNDEAKMIANSALKFIDQENIWCVDRLRRLSNAYLNHLFVTTYLVENYKNYLPDLSERQIFLLQNLLIYRPGDTKEEIDRIMKNIGDDQDEE